MNTKYLYYDIRVIILSLGSLLDSYRLYENVIVDRICDFLFFALMQSTTSFMMLKYDFI